MKDCRLKDIRKILERCWCPETSFHGRGEYEEQVARGVRSFGQCYVTAKAIQKIFGGNIVQNRRLKHYWNKLPDGTEVDFTSDQFRGDGIKPILHKDNDFERLRRYMGSTRNPAKASERFKKFFDCVRDPLMSRKSERS